MTWELAAAILVAPVPWFVWLISMQMKPTNSPDDWRPLVVWALRLASFLLFVLCLGIADTWATDNGASTAIQNLFDTPLRILIPLTWVSVSLYMVYGIVKSVLMLRFRRLHGKNTRHNRRRPQFL